MSSMILLLVLLSVSGCGERGPERVVREFLAAMNDHDVERALAIMHRDYVFRDEAGTFAIPRDRVRPMLEWDAATRARAEGTIVGVSGDTVRVRFRETNDFLDLLGVGPWTHEAKLVARDGTLRATVVDAPGELMGQVDRALEPVIDWARRTRPERLDGLSTGAGLVYDGDTARRWVGLLREAREEGVLETGEEREP